MALAKYHEEIAERWLTNNSPRLEAQMAGTIDRFPPRPAQAGEVYLVRDGGSECPPIRRNTKRILPFRRDLDAAFFHRCGLNREEAAYLMDRFRIAGSTIKNLWR
jgi:hypothetical protein